MDDRVRAAHAAECRRVREAWETFGALAAPGERCWWAVHTKAGQEARAEAALAELGLRTWWPRYRKRVRWGRRGAYRTVVRSWFSRYLFVRCGRPALWQVWSRPGVVSVVGIGGEPMPIPDRVMAPMLERAPEGLMENPGVRTDFAPVKVGDRVEVVDGPFARLVGEVQRVDGARSLLLWLEAHGRGLPVRVAPAAVRVPA